MKLEKGADMFIETLEYITFLGDWRGNFCWKFHLRLPPIAEFKALDIKKFSK